MSKDTRNNQTFDSTERIKVHYFTRKGADVNTGDISLISHFQRNLTPHEKLDAVKRKRK